jgi:hypothetical protein
MMVAVAFKPRTERREARRGATVEKGVANVHASLRDAIAWDRSTVG